MQELVQLEGHIDDFARRQTRVIVISTEGLEDARKTQERFPNLIVLSDQGHGLSDAVELIDTNNRSPHDNSAIVMPTTILVDRHGTVRWLFRPDEVITRLSADEVLSAVDQHMQPRSQ